MSEEDGSLSDWASTLGISDWFEDVKDDIAKQWNRGIGYLKGRSDAAFEDINDDLNLGFEGEGLIPSKSGDGVPIITTPVGRWIAGNGGLPPNAFDPDQESYEDYQQRMTTSDPVTNLNPQGGNQPQSMSEVQSSPWYQEAWNSFSSIFEDDNPYELPDIGSPNALSLTTGVDDPSKTQQQRDLAIQQTQQALAASHAISPLLVTIAGFRPKQIRLMMGLHLAMDASTGVLDFRSPHRDKAFGFAEFVSPYASMVGLAVANLATETWN